MLDCGDNTMRGSLIVALIIFSTSTSFAERPTDQTALARQAVRCSFVYGMAAAVDSRPQNKISLLGLQASLVSVAQALGSSADALRTWQEEFMTELFAAIERKQGGNREMTDPAFLPTQIDTCQSFLATHRSEFQKLLMP